jgi:ASC-1-like (ASCH) protein
LIILAAIITHFWPKFVSMRKRTYRAGDDIKKISKIEISPDEYENIDLGLKNKALVSSQLDIGDVIILFCQTGECPALKARVIATENYTTAEEAFCHEGYKSFFPQAQSMADALSREANKRGKKRTRYIKFHVLA